MISWKSSAQIITSKKEAIKKGVYAYSDNEAQNRDAVISEKKAKKLADSYKARERKNETAAKGDDPVKVKLPAETEKENPDYEPEPLENYFAQQVVNNAMEFEGVNYRTGGTTKDGMDCSGMVYTTFRIFDVTLPRSSYQMAKAGRKIDIKDVKKGDLLFFDNNPRRKRINHVGLVTEVTPEGDIKFIHSTLQLGVVVSSLSEPYYDRTFVQANRVIED